MLQWGVRHLIEIIFSKNVGCREFRRNMFKPQLYFSMDSEFGLQSIDRPNFLTHMLFGYGTWVRISDGVFSEFIVALYYTAVCLRIAPSNAREPRAFLSHKKLTNTLSDSWKDCCIRVVYFVPTFETTRTHMARFTLLDNRCPLFSKA